MWLVSGCVAFNQHDYDVNLDIVVLESEFSKLLFSYLKVSLFS